MSDYNGRLVSYPSSSPTLNSNLVSPPSYSTAIANDDNANNSNANEGAFAEQFVSQELLTVGNQYENTTLYFWERESPGASAEVVRHTDQFPHRPFGG